MAAIQWNALLKQAACCRQPVHGCMDNGISSSSSSGSEVHD